MKAVLYIYSQIIFDMIRKLILLFIIANSLGLSAQIADNFTDGDFTSNPNWSGNDTSFIINSANQLQLNSVGTDTSVLITPNQMILNTQWEFYINQKFNSSSNNYSRIYLTSNQTNLKGSLDGYFVQFGSTQDDITLNRQDGKTLIQLIQSPTGITSNSSNNIFRIKVIRDNTGNWELLADASANYNYTSFGSILDTTYKTSNYFGVFCKYTSSYATKVYFDDFLVQAIQVDSFPPTLTKLAVINDNQLDLYFDEPIDSLTAINSNNYLINNNIGIPNLAILDNQNPSIIHLFFNNKFQLGTNYILTIDNLSDLKGNIIQQFQTNFTYYLAQTGDIQINEIMADPSPVVGLPDAEYLELFNASLFPISLSGWHLIIGSNDKELPDTNLNPGDYLIICHDNNASAFTSYGKVLSLSSFSLVNSGQQIFLNDKKGGLIHQILYSDSWYGQSSKSEGGWSLEQIDVSNFCGGASNWWASNNSKGGTPGKINSIAASKPDIAAPQISRIAVIDSTNVLVVFSESIDSTGIFNPLAYNILDSIGYPISVISNFPLYNNALLKLPKALKDNTIYKLQIKDTLTDCVENILQINTTLAFGIAKKPEKFDLVINEILFDPKTDGVDFVEIYNRSDKILDINGLRLANFDFGQNDFEGISIITNEPFAIFPGEYYVLTTSAEIIKSQYFCRNYLNFISMSDFPTMGNSSGNIYLVNPSLEVIDSLLYSDEMHFSMLKSFDGVSLERINFNRFNDNNWHSASETSGFGTPTYINSQYSASDLAKGNITISPEVFSPDNDGIDDFLSINYDLPIGTIFSKIIIYDAAGRIIRNLTSNTMVGTTGIIYWDGLNEQNSKADIGIYIIYIETINPSGTTERIKRIITLAGRL